MADFRRPSSDLPAASRDIMDPYSSGYSVGLPLRDDHVSRSNTMQRRGKNSISSLGSSHTLVDIPEHSNESESGSSNASQDQTQQRMKPATRDPFLPFVWLPIRDHVKTALLLTLSLVTLPISYSIAAFLTILPSRWITYLFPFSPNTLTSVLAHRAQCRADPSFRRRTVLVTGIGMTKGLTLARAFWLCGHRVVGADFNVNRSGMWTPWKEHNFSHVSYSLVFDSMYSLKKPEYRPDMTEAEKREVQATYVKDIRDIVLAEGIDLWVSCSGVASAVEDALVKQSLDRARAEENSTCRAAIQFDASTTQDLHEKSSFIELAGRFGMLVPETFTESSQHDVIIDLFAATERNPDRKFILKPVGMDDANRGNMTLLPLSTQAETENYIHQLPISKERPWILQQFISGNKEYCTHSLVVNGVVKVFTSCPSSELLMHYASQPAEHGYNKAMLEFTERFAAEEQILDNRRGSNFTGHLSFDFMAERSDEIDAVKLYAIECNPRAHTAVALFAAPGPELRAMVNAYLSAIGTNQRVKTSGPKEEKHTSEVVRPPVDAANRYWIGHDLVELVFIPALDLVRFKLSIGKFVASLVTFADHVLHWQDGVFELWDPWPFVALYHHYWPKAILEAWWKGQRWSRVNVSTTKMFMC